MLALVKRPACHDVGCVLASVAMLMRDPGTKWGCVKILQVLCTAVSRLPHGGCNNSVKLLSPRFSGSRGCLGPRRLTLGCWQPRSFLETREKPFLFFESLGRGWLPELWACRPVSYRTETEGHAGICQPPCSSAHTPFLQPQYQRHSSWSLLQLCLTEPLLFHLLPTPQVAQGSENASKPGLACCSALPLPAQPGDSPGKA